MTTPKALIRMLDETLLRGAIMKRVRQARIKQLEYQRTFDDGHKWVIHTRANPNDLIAKLCDKYGSDKGSITNKGPYPWRAHSYAGYYSNLLSHCRYSILRVFECGIGTTSAEFAANMGDRGKPGASLRVWRDYFPDAEIIGADIDKRVLFDETRIKTFHLDQTDPASIRTLWRECGTTKFDLMIDDGLHTFDAGKCLFEHSISQLASHGIYIIEDVISQDLVKYKDHFAPTDYNVDLVSLHQPGAFEVNNNLVVIRPGPSRPNLDV